MRQVVQPEREPLDGASIVVRSSHSDMLRTFIARSAEQTRRVMGTLLTGTWRDES